MMIWRERTNDKERKNLYEKKRIREISIQQPLPWIIFLRINFRG